MFVGQHKYMWTTSVFGSGIEFLDAVSQRGPDLDVNFILQAAGVQPF